MNYLVSIIMAALAAAVSYICLSRELFYKFPIISGKEACEELFSPSKKIAIISAAVVAVSVGLASIKLFSITDNAIDRGKIEIAMLCLAGSACVDVREHRIPNFFPAVLACAGIVLIMAGFIGNQPGAFAYLVSSTVAAVGTAAVLLTARVLTRSGVGLGDVKLLSALGIIGGVYTVCGTVFYGMCACAVVAVLVLITKKMKKNESLPFAPFIFLGFLVSIFTVTI